MVLMCVWLNFLCYVADSEKNSLTTEKGKLKKKINDFGEFDSESIEVHQ